MTVIYEDNHIIIVNKACSEIVQGDKTGDITLIDTVKSYIKSKYNKQGSVFLGLVHRLDRPTSGIVIFARTTKALTRLNKMFKEKQIKKKYWAVVNKMPPKEEGLLEHYLIKNNKQNKSYAFNNKVEGAKKSSLTYKLLCMSKKYYLLEIDLHTGRHHQIRAQLAAINCKIKGDLKYGFPRSNKNASIHLHARYIEFIHPVSKQKITITANPPDDVLWNEFTLIIDN